MFRNRLCAHRGAAFVLALVTTLVFAGGAVPVWAAPDPWSYNLPGFDPEQPLPTPFTYRSFEYSSPFRLLEFAKEPAPDIDDLEELGPKKNYPYGTYENMLASFREDKGADPKEWKTFVRGYVRGADSNFRGNAYDQFVNRLEGMDASIYMFDKAPPGAPTRRQPDAFPKQAGVGIPGQERKDSLTIAGRAGKQLDDYVKNVDALNTPMVYIFRDRPNPTALKKIEIANQNTMINQARAKANQPPVNAIVARRIPAIPQRVPLKDPVGEQALLKLWEKRIADAETAGRPAKWNGPPPAYYSDAYALTPPNGQIPADGALSDAVEQSADTPAEAAAERTELDRIGAELDNPDIGGDAEELGGVDFSTLQLRYVADTYHNGPGVRYAFQGDRLTTAQDGLGGRRAMQLASDAFFVWLSLPPSAFTVNLNPDEPNRIIEERFGRTDAGRVLLEADLTMKKSVAKFIHPDTPGGRRYWDSLRGRTKCLSMRQWIVPATATVRDGGNELFILDAPLEVKMESEQFNAQGAAGGACDTKQDAATTQHNEEVYRTTILPQIEKAVNTAPEYADLRRVYTSRVAAEWFRQRSLSKRTAYSDLISKGDISRWVSEEKWTSREVFDRYVRSYKQGEFNITRRTSDGTYVYTNTYVYGGVDFTRIPSDTVSATAFAREHPGLTSSVNDALYGPSGHGRSLWLGGLSASQPLAQAFARPAPATSNPLFPILAALPLIAWLVAGAWLVRRRHAQTAAAGA